MGQYKVAVQSKDKRAKNFNEVSLGYSKKISSDEAQRCPQCADPVCMKGCPIGINIPGFIRHLREGNALEALQIIKLENPFPSICGRICSAPCEAACILNDEKSPIGIRALERFAIDNGRTKTVKKSAIKGKRIAIIGSGPSGLTAAQLLAQRNYQVTIFEALDKPGGVLRYGIPEFRFPKRILDQEIEDIKALGIEIKTNFFIGQTVKLEELIEQGFSAVLLATGAGSPKFMDLPGANLGGVYYGEEFLMRVNLIKSNSIFGNKLNFALGKKVVVIGSGNTALDCARAALRLGRETTLIFRRTVEEMRVREEERELAQEEGIHFEPLVKPLEVLSNDKHFVGGLKCIRMDYAETKIPGEWELLPVEDSEFMLEVDTVIIAVGHIPNSLISRFSLDLELDEDATIRVDGETYMTSIPGVFACGNVVTNAGPVVEAIAAGKAVVEQIDRYLKKG